MGMAASAPADMCIGMGIAMALGRGAFIEAIERPIATYIHAIATIIRRWYHSRTPR